MVTWEAFGASSQGASHGQQQKPNQDAVGTWTDAASASAIVVVSDGHGSAMHPRSALGSTFAVDSAIARLQSSVAADAAPNEPACRAALRDIVERWLQRVREHVVASPLHRHGIDAVNDGARGQLEADPAIAYGATLVAAVATPRWIMILQIGDGDVLTVDAEGATARALPDDPRLRQGRTLSLCQPNVWNEARVRAIASSPLPQLLLLATDGYANSFETDADFLAIGGDYVSLIADYPEAVRAQLPSILAETSSGGSGDDITLAVLHRAAAVSADGRKPLGADAGLMARVRSLFKSHR